MPSVKCQSNKEMAVWDSVISDMIKRDELGTKNYGERLRPFNGRDALQDAYEEALDLAVYLKQAIIERDKFNGNKERDSSSLVNEAQQGKG